MTDTNTPADSTVFSKAATSTQRVFATDKALDTILSKPREGNEQKEEVQEGQEEELLEDEGVEATAEQVEAEKAAPKIMKMKVADKELDVPNDALFKVKVDGEMQDASLQDLLHDYSGKKGYEKKFQALADDKKQFLADVKAVDGKLREIMRLSKKDGIGAFKRLYEMSGMDTEAAQKAVDEMIVSLQKEVEESYKLTDAERELKALKRQREAELEEKSVSEEEQNLKKAEKEIIDYSLTLMDKHQVSGDEFQKAWEVLAGIKRKDPKFLDGLTGKELADKTVQYVMTDRHFTMIENGIAKVHPGKEKDNEFVMQISKAVRAIDAQLNEEDVAEIVKEILPVTSKVRKSKDPAKQLSETAKPEAPKKTEETKNEAPDYRNFHSWADKLASKYAK